MLRYSEEKLQSNLAYLEGLVLSSQAAREVVTKVPDLLVSLPATLLRNVSCYMTLLTCAVGEQQASPNSERVAELVRKYPLLLTRDWSTNDVKMKLRFCWEVLRWSPELVRCVERFSSSFKFVSKMRMHPLWCCRHLSTTSAILFMVSIGFYRG